MKLNFDLATEGKQSPILVGAVGKGKFGRSQIMQRDGRDFDEHSWGTS
jgi:hypothetical protein